MNTLRTKAVMFGINYINTPDARLQGCINDVTEMAMVCKTLMGIQNVTLYTDDKTPADTTKAGIIQRLTELATASVAEKLDLVWVHYSGHGSYMRDTNGDERDGRDECLVPSDFMTAGFLMDDVLSMVFAKFNPKTRVICVFDSCHSATVTDVKYSWLNPQRATVENLRCTIQCPMLTLSGCMDNQTSADAFNVLGDRRFVGALTGCLVLLLRKNIALYKKNVFKLVEDLRIMLKQRGFTQIPWLCSTHNVAKDPVLLPF